MNNGVSWREQGIASILNSTSFANERRVLLAVLLLPSCPSL